MRVAFSSIVAKTGSRSSDDLLITCSSSDVPVCCSNASVRSSGALAQFVEQPRVLDGDDGLGSEVLHKCDLFIAERTHF